jgi:hypothetical protein
MNVRILSGFFVCRASTRKGGDGATSAYAHALPTGLFQIGYFPLSLCDVRAPHHLVGRHCVKL